VVSFRNIDPLAGSGVSYIPHLKTLMALIRRYASESTVILGGSGFTLFPMRLMQEIPEADLGFCGEADTAFAELLENPDAPWKVPGVLWRNKADILGTGTTAGCGCPLDELPFPDWRQFDPNVYRNHNHYVPVMGVETKRGCPYLCSYCLYPALQGNHFRLRSPKRVVDELETLHHNFHIDSVHFTDPVLNQPVEHLRSICREILNRKLNIGWTGFFREEDLTPEDLELYRKAGLMTCCFSGDGTSDWALNLLGKGIKQADILRAAQVASDSEVLAVYHFLVNLPGETQKTADDSRKLLDRLFEIHAGRKNLGTVVINNVRLYPGSALTQSILRKGLISPDCDLLYPTYFNPPPWDFLRHELTANCMKQCTLNFLSDRK
jgi:putative variant cofactor biosynthesis B12-binding/radical SAM domain protein 1